MGDGSNVELSMKSLSDNLESLYVAFGDVPKPTTIAGCPCCIENKSVCVLLATPLRDLSMEDLWSYARSAFLTVGDLADYLYFLPRIIEISVTEKGWWPEAPIIGRAVAETMPLKWPVQRREALIEVLHAMIQEVDLDWTGGDSIDDWICAIAKMGLEVEPFLHRLESMPNHLLAYYEANSGSLMKQRLNNAFWDAGEPGYDTVLEWITNPRVSDLIFKAYGLSPGGAE